MAKQIKSERQRRNEIKKKLSDEEIFCSKKFLNELSSMNRYLLMGTKKRIQVHVFYDRSDPEVACTNGNDEIINAGNSITASFPTRKLKMLSIIGLNGHEIGHVKFSDFSDLSAYAQALNDCRFYPEAPVPESKEEDEFLSEWEDYAKNNKEATAAVVSQVALFLNNAIEDVWMEAHMCAKYPGDIRKGIELNSFRLMEQKESIEKMIRDNAKDFDVMFSLVLQYARHGDINNWERAENRYTEFLSDVEDLIDEAVVDDDHKRRKMAVNQILLRMWPELKKEIDQIRPGESKKPQNGDTDASQSNAGNGNENSQQGAGGAGADNSSGNGKNPAAGNATPLTKKEQEKVNQFAEKLAKLDPNASKMPQGISGKPGNDGNKTGANAGKTGNESSDFGNDTGDGASDTIENRKEFRKNLNAALKGSVKEEGGRFTTEGREAEFLNNLETENDIWQPEVNGINDRIEEVLNEMAEEQMKSEQEYARKRELETALRECDLTELHRVPRKIFRVGDVPQAYINVYNAVYPQVKKTSRKLQDKMLEVLQKQEGGRENSLFIGKKMDKRLYRQDGRIFCKDILPEDGLDLAVGLVIDMSGSMSQAGRIDTAKIAALTLYDFCHALDIPVAVYGHRVRSNVELYNFADFKSVDGKDKYRLMGICAGGCNRDGLAYRFVGKQLAERTESTKLLIMISDGQPNDSGYGGAIARDDLMSAKLMLKKQGVTTFAAAIGDDREVIEKIYGDGFLNISDLKKLPANIVRLVERYII